MASENKEVLCTSVIEVEESNSTVVSSNNSNDKINIKEENNEEIESEEKQTIKMNENKENKKKMYELNKEKAMEFIGNNVATENMEKEVKSSCVNFKMNSGTYNVLVTKQFMKIKHDEEIHMGKHIIKCVKNDSRYDKNNANVENLLYFERRTDKIEETKSNAHFYHTKHKITVQGPDFETFSTILEQYFKKQSSLKVG